MSIVRLDERVSNVQMTERQILPILVKNYTLKASQLSEQLLVEAIFPSTNAQSKHRLREVSKLVYLDKIPVIRL